MRRPVLRRIAAAAALPVLLVPALTGCGSKDASNASDSSDVAMTSYGRYSAGQEVNKAAFFQDVLKGFQKATTAQLAVNLDHGSGDPVTATGQIDLTADPLDAAVSVTLPQASKPFDVRLVDNVAYADLGPLTNDKYVKVDLSDPKNLPPQVQGMLDGVDPAKLFAKLAPSLTSVTYVGDEQVDGTTTRHFTLAVDTSKMTSMMPSKMDAPQSADIPKQVSVDAWFDSDFLVRKIEATTDGDQAIKVLATFSHWGDPVDIQAPPADQVSSRAPFGWSAYSAHG